VVEDHSCDLIQHEILAFKLPIQEIVELVQDCSVLGPRHFEVEYSSLKLLKGNAWMQL
jgi:hypothetical protein